MKVDSAVLFIMFILTVFILFVLAYGFYVEYTERKLPRWKRVSYYLKREFLQEQFIHSQDDITEVKIILIDRYKLTPELAHGALDNIYNDEWLELNII